MLIDPDTGSRDSLRMVLKNNGFREFRLGTTLADVSEQFAVRMPDLLIEARKPFVVTTDYVGPDRRKTSDREDTIPRVEVPNPLRAKAIGTKDIALDQKAMADAIANINLRKLERYAVQIGVLTELIVPAYESGAFDQSVKDHVDQLMYVAEDTSRRLVGTKYIHIFELCDSLLSVVDSIAASGDAAQPKDLKLLPNLAKAIEKTFDVKEDTEAIARKIAASVRKN